MTRLQLFLLLFFLPVSLFAQQPRLVLPVGHTAFISRADYSSDGKLVISSGLGAQLFVWEAGSGRLLHVFEIPGTTAMRAFFSPDSRHVVAVSTGAENNAVVWQLETGKQLIKTTAENIGDLVFYGPNLLVVSNADSVTVHRLDKATSFVRKKMHGSPVFVKQDLISVIYQKDHSLTLERWNIHTQKSAGTVQLENSSWVTASEKESRYSPFRFSNLGKYLLLDHGAGSSDSIHLYSTTSGRHLHAAPAYRWTGSGAMFNMTDEFFTYPIGQEGHMLVIDLKRNTRSMVEFMRGEQVMKDSFVYVFNNDRVVINDTGLVTKARIGALNLYTKEKELLYYGFGHIDQMTLAGHYIIANYIPIRPAVTATQKDDDYSSNIPSRVLVLDLHRQAAAFDLNKKSSTKWTPTNTIAAVADLPGIFQDHTANLMHEGKLLLIRDTTYAIVQWDIRHNKLLTRMQGKNSKPSMLSFIDTNYLFSGTQLIDIKNGGTVAQLPGAFIEWNEAMRNVKLRLMDSSVAVYDIYGRVKAHAAGVPISSGLTDDWNYLFAALKDSVRVAGIQTGEHFTVPGNFEVADEGGKYLVTTTGSHAKPVGKGWNYETQKKDTTMAVSDAMLYIWELPTGKLLQQVPAEYVQALPDSSGNIEYLVAEKEITKGRDYLSTTWIHHLKTARTLEIPGTFEEARENNRYITIKEEDKNYRYELPQGRKLETNEEEEAGAVKPKVKEEPADDAGHIRYSRDNRYQLSFKDTNTAVVFEVGKGLVTEFPFNSTVVPTKEFSFSVDPARRYLFYSDFSQHGLVDIKSKKVSVLKNFPPNDFIKENYFTKNGKLITIAQRPTTYYFDFVLSAWDIATGKGILTVEADPYRGNFLFTTSEDDKLASVYTEGMLHLYDLNKGQLLYKYLPIAGEGGLTLDAGNHYDGSEAARQLLYFSCGKELVSLSQVKDQLWVPNLAERIMKGESINAASLSDLNICGFTPLIESRQNNKAYHYLIIPRKGGLGETVLYVNGIEVKRYKPAELEKQGASFQLHISSASLEQYFIEGEENKVTVKVYAQDNDISSRELSLRKYPSSKDTIPPNLYAVMVGVSDYKGEELDLKYAAKDAQDLSSVVAASARKLLNRDRKEHVFMYNVTTDAHRSKFPEKESIRQVFSEIGQKAQAKDILLVFFAGHGVMEGEKKRFYFLTAEASKNGDVVSTGISIAELNEWMKPQNIKAQKRILIFDACNSGQAINDLVTIGNKDDKYVAARNDDESNRIKALEKLNERAGMFVLSASATNQSAYELGRYSQGVLTYALLKAIKEDATILEDGKLLNVDKWFSTAERTVTDIISQTGNRQQPQKFGTGGFNIGEVDKDVIAGIQLPQAKPLFTASNFINPSAGDDDLELTKEVNSQMGEIAARGGKSDITYVMASNDPAAYTLTGTYDNSGTALKVKVNIKQNKEIKHRFEVTGTNKVLSGIAEEILIKVEQWVREIDAKK